jgi:diguanylate cyclase (GGDEF)-like protein
VARREAVFLSKAIDFGANIGLSLNWKNLTDRGDNASKRAPERCRFMKTLLVEDNSADARLIREMLKETSAGTFEVQHVARLDKAMECLHKETFDVVLLDLGLPDAQGMESLTLVHKTWVGLPIVVLTGLDNERFALEVMSAGAQDYLVKGQFDTQLLVRTIRYAVKRKQAEEEVRLLNAELEMRVAERTAQIQTANEELRKEIIERKRIEEALRQSRTQLENIAHYDLLTGLPNRVLLSDRLQQAMVHTVRREQLLAVALIDLDGFKTVNDRYGHDVGDQLLNILAIRMKHALREGDTLARLGGDEFVAVMVDLGDTGAAVPVLTRLLNAVAEQVQISESILRVSASVGVTFYPQQEDADGDQLMRQADQAMYQAKMSGKNRFQVFDLTQDRFAHSRHGSIHRIRQALSANEFVLHYQPKVNMCSGEVVGAEALVRWQHPERGLLLPGMFLPEIEDHLLAVEIGEWVIDSALTQMESWQADGFNISVSVNLSALQLLQGNFVDRLRMLLAAHPLIQPSSLELEVLESSDFQSIAQVVQVLDACRKIGVTFALDDFGSSYSSLNYLKRLPVSVLKIDQNLVSETLNNAENLSTLEGILGLAVLFHRQVIAEGIESVDHGLILLRLGCELAQGYGIARPMPAHELPGWAAVWRPDSRWVNVCSPEDLELVRATVDYRSLIESLDDFLRGNRQTAPRMDSFQSRLDEWIEAKLMDGRIDLPTLHAIQTLHRQVLDLAADILDLHVLDRTPEALAKLTELYDLRDRILEQLDGLAC